ncbi:DNA replication licensing factor mcm8 [Trebouxia sp. C0010 RCD-2024]
MQTLLGPLEQQEVNVAKAGLVASLPARTSLLAAANPGGGQYNRAKTLMQNLKMSAAMLSRFDIIFVLLDQPDQRRDERLSEHVMAMHSGRGDRVKKACQGSLQARSAVSIPGLDSAKEHSTLEDRLKIYSDEAQDPLPMQLLQKYIAYARQFCHPVLSDDAKQILKEHYCQLRQDSLMNEGTPVTARQLESLIRMSEARARLELVQVVTAQHAQEVIELSQEAASDVQGAGAGASCLDFRVPGAARAGSKQAEARRFLSALGHRAAQSGNSFSVHQLFDLSDHLQLKVPNMRLFIDQLNDAGELLKKGPQTYALQSVPTHASQPASSQISNYSAASQSCLPTGILVSVPPVILNESILPSVGSVSLRKRPKLHLTQAVPKTYGLEDLPDEIFGCILGQCFTPRDFCSLSQVSLRYSQVASSDVYWETAYCQRYGAITDVTRDAATLAKSWKELFRCRTVTNKQVEPRLSPCFYELTAILQRIAHEQAAAAQPGGVIFLLDGSGSVSTEDFDVMTHFVYKAVPILHEIAPATKVGIIQFSTDVHIQQPLAHVDRTNLVGIMTDMVSRQLTISPATSVLWCSWYPCMSGYNV